MPMTSPKGETMTSPKFDGINTKTSKKSKDDPKEYPKSSELDMTEVTIFKTRMSEQIEMYDEMLEQF